MLTSGLLAFAAGLLTIASPCILPVLPIVLSRSLMTHRYGVIALVLGLVAGFAVTGSLIGATSQAIPIVASGLRTAALVILLAMGLLACFPQWTAQTIVYFTSRIPHRQTSSKSAGLMGEFWLGTQLGLLWTPCAGPILGSIIVLAAVKQQILSAFMLLLLYGLGAGLPLLVLAYTSRQLRDRVLKLRHHGDLGHRLAGVAITVTAIAIFMGWDIELQLWAASFLPKLPL